MDEKSIMMVTLKKLLGHRISTFGACFIKNKHAADAILSGIGGVLLDVDPLKEIHLPVPKRSGQEG